MAERSDDDSDDDDDDDDDDDGDDNDDDGYNGGDGGNPSSWHIEPTTWQTTTLSLTISFPVFFSFFFTCNTFARFLPFSVVNQKYKSVKYCVSPEKPSCIYQFSQVSLNISSLMIIFILIPTHVRHYTW